MMAPMAAAKIVQARTPPPSAVVIGITPTTTVNSPIVAKIFASELMRSRSFWSTLRAGTRLQYGMSFSEKDRLQST